MDEYKMDFQFEPQSEELETPMKRAQSQPESTPDMDKFSIPDKKTRRKLFWLIACMALVAALGGSALTAAIQAIAERNAAEQALLSAQEQQKQDGDNAEQKPEEKKTEPEENGQYSLERAELPKKLPSNSGDRQLTPAEVYAQNVGAVVSIRTTKQATYYDEEYTTGSVGSGFVLTEDGFILTNCHLVTDAKTTEVTLYSGESYEAEIIGADKTGDIALLKIEAENLQTVTIAPEEELSVGTEVVAIGNPFGELSYTMTHGYISGLDREVTVDTTPIRMIQTDTAINSGNSGGPLLDMNGNVIGVAAAKYSGVSSSGASIENVSFAIPIHDALKIVYDLQDYGYVRGRAYLGVTVLDLDALLAEAYGLPVGPRVETVTPESCAEKAGIQVGDFILAVGEEETENTTALLAALRDHRAGETVTVKIYRAGAELEVEVTLDERPQNTETTQSEPVED